MQLMIETDIEQVRRRLAGLEKQVNFAASKALNDMAQRVQKAVPALLQARLDRPTPFTAQEGAMFIKPARRDRLEAEVLFKDRQASYMRYQVEGGVRQPTNKALRLPTAISLDAFGNLPRGVIKQLISVARKEAKLAKRQSRRIRVSNKVDLFYGDPKDVGGHKMPAGIYKIIKLSASRSQLVPLIVFPKGPATYSKRVELLDVAVPIVTTHFEPVFTLTSKTVMLLTQADYARHRGCSREAVRQAVAAGRITVIGDDKLIDPQMADIQWAANTRTRASTPPRTDLVKRDAAPAEVGSAPAAAPAVQAAPVIVAHQVDAPSTPDDYWASRARRESAEASIAEMKRAEMEGQLLRADAVRSAWARRIATARDALLQIPSRLAPLLAAESSMDRVAELLELELRQALADLSGASGEPA